MLAVDHPQCQLNNPRVDGNNLHGRAGIGSTVPTSTYRETGQRYGILCKRWDGSHLAGESLHVPEDYKHPIFSSAISSLTKSWGVRFAAKTISRLSSLGQHTVYGAGTRDGLVPGRNFEYIDER